MATLVLPFAALLSFAPALRTTSDVAVHSGRKVVAWRCTAAVSMAGFGGGAAAPKKATGKKSKASGASKSRGKTASKAGLDAMKQWAIYSELRTIEDVTTTSVYAKLPDEGEKWKEVGGCVVQLPGSRQQGVMLHKRLILEHAARLYPSHALRSRELLCGYTDQPGTMQSTEADIVPLAKCELPDDLRAGFCGLPDAKTNMYATKSTAPSNKDGSTPKGANRDSKGRI